LRLTGHILAAAAQGNQRRANKLERKVKQRELKALQLMQQEGLKPSMASKRCRVSVWRLYKLHEVSKRPARQPRVRLADNSQVIGAIARELAVSAPATLTLADLR
jgi:hypothetical protein